MKHIVISALLAVFVIGCGTNEPKPSTMEVNPATAIKINSRIPYKSGSAVALNIKNECKLDTQLSEFIRDYSVGEGIGIIRTLKLNKSTKGKVLLVEITEAVSSGNAFIGHRKFTSIKGDLYDNGKRKSGFTAARLSGGGAWAGFKGSCSVLGRTVKTLGSDVSRWLKNPVDGAHLGDRV